MTGTIITVQGSASEWLDAERATVTIRVSFDGPQRQPVFATATDAAAHVTAALRELEGGAVTRWSAERVAVWSQRPWNQDGKQLDPVYTAALSVTARFQDFDALAGFVERFATAEGVNVVGIEWDLTEETRKAAESRVRTAAVGEATAKARAYAEAAGLGALSPLAIADPGMLGDGGAGGISPQPMAFKAMRMAEAADAGGSLSFTPDRIEVAAAVDARFGAV